MLLAQGESFQAETLLSALEETFTTRGTHPLPDEVPLPPASWARPYREMADQVGLSPDLEVGHQVAGAFLDPVLRHAAHGSMRWDVSALGWASG